MGKIRTLALATGVSLVGAFAFVASTANAATLAFTGVGTTYLVKNNDIEPSINGTLLDYIDGSKKNATNGLSVTGPAKITFTYLGYEAGNKNYAADLGGTFFKTGVTAIGATKSVTQLASGLIDFIFGTTAPANRVGTIDNAGVALPASKNFAIGYKILSATTAWVFFDDLARDDRDFDDIGMLVSVAPIPVPAAGFLLLGGLGGLAALRRRKQA